MVVHYDTLAGFTCPAMQAKADCAFAGARAESAVSLVCGRAKAACDRGIVGGG